MITIAVIMISGFFCFSETAAQSVLEANARGALAGDYSEEAVLVENLINAGNCIRVADEHAFDAHEVYRGKSIPVKGGPPKQVIGLAQMAGQPPQLFAIDNSNETSL